MNQTEKIICKFNRQAFIAEFLGAVSGLLVLVGILTAIVYSSLSGLIATGGIFLLVLVVTIIVVSKDFFANSLQRTSRIFLEFCIKGFWISLIILGTFGHVLIFFLYLLNNPS